MSRKCNHSLKLTLKALKDAKLIKDIKISKHVDEKLVGQIREYWNEKGWETAPDKLQHYEMTAKKFNVSSNQVQDILKWKDV